MIFPLTFGIFICLFGTTEAAECPMDMGKIQLEYTVATTNHEWQEKYGYYNIYQWKQIGWSPDKDVQVHIPGAKITY